MGRSKLLRSPAMLGAGERHYEWKFDFMGNSKWFFAMSGCILIIGSLAVATKQLNFGIDFESGTRVTASLERDVTVEGVRDALQPLGLGDAKIQEVQNPELGDHVVQISTSELGPGGVQRLERLLDESSESRARACRASPWDRRSARRWRAAPGLRSSPRCC